MYFNFSKQNKEFVKYFFAINSDYNSKKSSLMSVANFKCYKEYLYFYKSEILTSKWKIITDHIISIFNSEIAKTITLINDHVKLLLPGGRRSQ